MKRIKNNVLLVTGLLALLGINSCIENCQGVKSIHFGEVKLEQPSLDFIPENEPTQQTFVNNLGDRTTFTLILNKTEIRYDSETLYLQQNTT